MIYIKNLKKNEKLKLEAVEVLPGEKRLCSLTLHSEISA